eukprot:1142065-Pelagomonas_calceolata.AAC.2
MQGWERSSNNSASSTNQGSSDESQDGASSAVLDTQPGKEDRAKEGGHRKKHKKKGKAGASRLVHHSRKSIDTMRSVLHLGDASQLENCVAPCSPAGMVRGNPIHSMVKWLHDYDPAPHFASTFAVVLTGSHLGQKKCAGQAAAAQATCMFTGALLPVTEHGLSQYIACVCTAALPVCRPQQQQLRQPACAGALLPVTKHGLSQCMACVCTAALPAVSHPCLQAAVAAAQATGMCRSAPTCNSSGSSGNNFLSRSMANLGALMHNQHDSLKKELENVQVGCQHKARMGVEL